MMANEMDNSQQDSIETLRNLRHEINTHYLMDESVCVTNLLAKAINADHLQHTIEFRARDLVDEVRDNQKNKGTIEAFIHEYNLSSEEGVVLMCLAEALLRIPDDETADKLIRDKIAPAEWNKHKGVSNSLFVNASTWGLMLTGRLVSVGKSSVDTLDTFSRLVARVGEPIVRTVLRKAMKIMGSQYVMGDTIESACKRSLSEFDGNYRFSYDMLGEAAMSREDSSRYIASYTAAIEHLIQIRSAEDSIYQAPSISIKLSALHPRYEYSKRKSVLDEMKSSLLQLVLLAKSGDIALTLDAEEVDRLDLSLDLFESVKVHEGIAQWNGFGLAVQAYQKRALPVLKWTAALASATQSRIPVRLVKGAYWDTEIKRAQELGLDTYPVFTRKCSTDISYITCVKFLIENNESLFPQFATHNAHTIATIQELVTDTTEYEFQRLHGMGQSLYGPVIKEAPCRVYAPVGDYKDLLPYLVRRLLENGANSSFVSRIEDASISPDLIVEHPQDVITKFESLENPNIPLPADLFAGTRHNSKGVNLADYAIENELLNAISSFRSARWLAKPTLMEEFDESLKTPVFSPAYQDHVVGHVALADAHLAHESILYANCGLVAWKATLVEERVEIIKKFAGLLQENRYELYSLGIFEAGKTVSDMVNELREAIDFCYYYSAQATEWFRPTHLPGPTGERNELQLSGRGVFVCISPWNFPVAIFTGQIVAALVCGNTVIAKPSSNTPLVAARIIELLYEAGVPKNVAVLLPCSGKVINACLENESQLGGVAFTGSFSTALQINRSLGKRASAIVPFIAETGGLNVMIVDSSALAEQVVKDVIASAFFSAGQRCSALRVLILQTDIAEKFIQMLVLAMKELRLGDPVEIETDVPPVVDANAAEQLNTYKKEMKEKFELICEMSLSEELEKVGSYVAPAVYKINSLSDLSEEKFGPILHVMQYDAQDLDNVLRQVNEMGYGLTLGVHTRIDETANYIINNANVGNVYVNRNMVGAVVGVQPFGGEGLSGTGPKAGGPNYLLRFCTEKTISINTAAVGGNTDLLSLKD